MKTMPTTAAGTTTQVTTDDVPRTLDDLAAFGSDALARLYAGAGVPPSLEGLVGWPKGRMLAVRATDGTPAFAALRFAAARSVFPWDGKTFGRGTPDEGTGVNRVKIGRLRYEWFPFRTRIEPSVLDGAPCIYLDYKQPGNPFFIARIRDEIREVHPGLFLGPAMWKTGPGATHVLWFAVDFNQPSA